MTKYPKTVCVVFNEFAQAMDARNNKKDAAFYQKRNMGHVFKRYHLHPGNEVKLKRENAAMRKWIIRENGGKRSAKKCPCLRCKKLREVVTDL